MQATAGVRLRHKKTLVNVLITSFSPAYDTVAGSVCYRVRPGPVCLEIDEVGYRNRDAIGRD